MPTPPAPSRSVTGDSPLLAAVADAQLSVRSIVARTLSATTPMTVLAGVVAVGIGVTGGNSAPIAFLAIALILLLFFAGYLGAVRLFPPVDASGAIYTLIRTGLGPGAGVGAAWVAVVSYEVLTLGLFGLIGSTLTPLLEQAFGIAVPWEVVAISAVIVVGSLNLLNVKVGTGVLKVLAGLEIVAILIVSVANWANPASSGGVFSSFDPAPLLDSLPITATWFALASLGFIGTELTVNHTADARTGHKGVRHATYGTLGVLVVVYVVGSSGLSVTLGPEQVVLAAINNPGSMFVGTALTNLGSTAATILQALFGTSVLAGAISFHGATASYCVHLGKDHNAPRFLARTSRRTGAPYVASLIQTSLALLAVGVVSALNADPVLVLFYLSGTAGAVGVLVLLSLTSVASLMLLKRPHPRHSARRGWLLAAAAISSLVVPALTVTVLIDLDTLLGVPPDSPLPNVVRFTILGIWVLGWLWYFASDSRDSSQRVTAGHAEATEVSGP